MTMDLQVESCSPSTINRRATVHRWSDIRHSSFAKNRIIDARSDPSSHRLIGFSSHLPTYPPLSHPRSYFITSSHPVGMANSSDWKLSVDFFERIPAGVYLSMNVDSLRRCKSAIRVLSSNESVAWGDVVILSLDASPALALDIRISFELSQISFSPARGAYPSLTLKVAVVHSCNIQDSALLDSVQDQYPVGRPDYAAALTNLAWARLFRFDHFRMPHDLDEAISLCEKVLLLRPVGYKYRGTSLDNLRGTLRNRFGQRGGVDDIDSHQSLLRGTIGCQGGSQRGHRRIPQFAPHGHPLRYTTVHNLGSALCSRFAKIKMPEKQFDCQELLDRDTQLRAFQNRIVTAWHWVTTAEQHSHTSASEAYNTCFDLLDGHLATRPSIISRRKAAAASSGTRSLPADAASRAIRSGNL
ncbi:hypothetical protein EDD22DRAFT_846288 [Suillus occidentalis]|nr:hypothetical protein EDD22DRAFT_846288 [Suillus occidentalis]